MNLVRAVASSGHVNFMETVKRLSFIFVFCWIGRTELHLSPDKNSSQENQKIS